jgi:hypothetical protein
MLVPLIGFYSLSLLISGKLVRIIQSKLRRRDGVRRRYKHNSCRIRQGMHF